MAKPMRAIAFYGLRKTGDSFGRFSQLIEGLAAKGVELTVVSRLKPKRATSASIDFHRLERPFGLRHGAILEFLQLLSAPWELLGRALKFGPTAIVVFDPVSSMLSWPAAIISRTPIYLVLISAPWRLSGRRRRNWIIRTILFLRDIVGLCCAKKIIVPSFVTANDILTQFDLLKRKLVVQPLPVPESGRLFGNHGSTAPDERAKKWKAEFSHRRQELLDRYDIPEKSFILCSFAERREFPELEVIFRALNAIGDESVFLLFCDNRKERTSLMSMAVGLGLTEQVVFVNQEKDFLSCVEGCDVCFAPGGYSGTSEMLLKALGCGVAVIAANSEENSEVIQREELMLEPGDVEALATRIRQLKTVRGRIEAVRAQAASRAEELSFDWSDKMIGNIFPDKSA